LGESPTAHIPNIGQRGAQRRLKLGILTLAAASLLAAFLFGLGAPRSWRLALFAPLWLAALGFFQARDKT
jgi:hypothetical protein